MLVLIVLFVKSRHPRKQKMITVKRLRFLILTVLGSATAISATETNTAPEYIILFAFWR